MTAALALKLTPKQDKFCTEYLIDLNGTQAAIRAGYSKKTAAITASVNIRNPNIIARLAELRTGLSDSTAITPERVLQELWNIATVDTNEIVEYRRTCCRHCHGEGFGYQFTDDEMKRRRAEWFKAAFELPAGGKQEPFDEKGGAGFDPRKDPRRDCLNCYGEGVAKLHIHDTRRLSPQARALYAGVKETRSGIEIKLHDKLSALDKIMKHLGMGNKVGLLPDDGSGGLVTFEEFIQIHRRRVEHVADATE